MKNQVTILSTALLFIASTISAPSAQAGGEVGNGGDAVVCPVAGTTTKKVETLDVFEARTLRGIKLDLGPSSLSWQDKVDLAIHRLDVLDVKRADRLRGWAKTFVADSVFAAGIVLTDIPDSKQVALPKDCTIEQVVVQKVPAFAKDRYYTFSKDLWDLLDSDNQAAIVLHELIYREAITFEHRNSTASRYFNSLVFSDSFQNMALVDYLSELDSLPFAVATYSGIEILIHPANCSSSSGFCASVVDQIRGSAPVRATTSSVQTYSFGTNFVSIDKGKEVTFYRSGRLDHAEILSGTWDLQGTPTEVSGDFYVDGMGTILNATFPKGTQWNSHFVSFWITQGRFDAADQAHQLVVQRGQVLVDGNPVKLEISGWFSAPQSISFHPGGTVPTSFTPELPTKLKHPLGVLNLPDATITADRRIDLNSSGRLKRAVLGDSQMMVNGTLADVSGETLFYPDQKLLQTTLKTVQHFPLLGNDSIDLVGKISFHQNGFPSTGFTATTDSRGAVLAGKLDDVELEVKGQKIAFTARNSSPSQFRFFPNGAIQQARAGQKYEIMKSAGLVLYTRAGKKVTYWAWDLLTFDIDGYPLVP